MFFFFWTEIFTRKKETKLYIKLIIFWEVELLYARGVSGTQRGRGRAEFWSKNVAVLCCGAFERKKNERKTMLRKSFVK